MHESVNASAGLKVNKDVFLAKHDPMAATTLMISLPSLGSDGSGPRGHTEGASSDATTSLTAGFIEWHSGHKQRRQHNT